MTDKTTHPPTLWAQRKEIILVTIDLEDTKNPTIILEANKLIFKSKGGHEGKMYEIDMELYGEISVPESKKHVTDRHVELMLRKKESGPYWPRLFKEKAKQHFLKVDFDKWRDEDDDVEEEDPRDLDQMLKDMGGINDAMPNMDDINNEDEGSDDSDDDDMPDLEEDKSDDKTEEPKDS